MALSYFNKSNIEKLTKKSRNKNKKITDKKAADEKDDKDHKIIEGFDPTSVLGGSSSGSGGGGGNGSGGGGGNGSGGGGGNGSGGGGDGGNGSGGGDSPYPNVFGSSDTSPTSTEESNTQQAAGDQLDSSSIITFCLHALMSVVFAYIWGWLATNFVYLTTESDKNMDYILPIDEYEKPYTNNAMDNAKKSYFSYGFPYDLGDGRDVGDTNDIKEIRKRQYLITYYPWLSQNTLNTDTSGLTQKGFFEALVQYIFAAVYGGFGRQGGRYIMRRIIGVFSVSDIDKPDTTDTWNRVKNNKIVLKIASFILWPLIIMQFIFPIVGIWSAGATFIFGILQTHIVWGLLFSFTIGIFLAMGSGIYMALNALYVFFIYPWANDNKDSVGKWKDIFVDLIPYMLFIFYFQICIYGYKDLGGAGGAGIMCIVAASIGLQFFQNMK
jgi:hypothetical protein